MSRAVLVIFLTFCASLMSVEAATCGTLTSLTCQRTDKTLATCINGICQCENGYFPIRSGCGRKLDKPTAQWEQGRTNEVVEGENATLRCSSVDDATVYEWFKNGKFLGAGQNYTITYANIGSVGNFSCRAKLTTGDSYLDSDRSDEIQIKLLATFMGVSNSRPIVVVPTPYIFNNKAVSLSCVNVPMGYNVSANVVYEDTSNPAKTIAHETSPPFRPQDTSNPAKIISSIINVNSPNACSNVTCRLNDSSFKYTAPKSSPVSLPQITPVIVDVTVTGGPSKTTVYSSKSAVSLTCQTTPDVQYINTYVAFFWQDHGITIDGQTEKVLVVPKSEATHVITCMAVTRFRYDSTNNVTITMNDTYLAAPVIQVSSLAPFTGSRVVMSCGDVIPGAATYSWTKDGTPIARQFDRTIQLDNFLAADAGIYTCSVAKDGFSVTSNLVNLTLSTGLSTPVITRNDSAKTFGEFGTYQLMCNTASYTVGMSFVWKKCTEVLNETSRVYQITVASRQTDQGLYLCQANFNSGQSAFSAPYEVIMSAPGLHCTTHTDCPVSPAYTGSCDSTKNRCTCSRSYKPVGNICEACTSLQCRVCSLDTDCPTSPDYTGRCDTTTLRCQCATNYLLIGDECQMDTSVETTDFHWDYKN